MFNIFLNGGFHIWRIPKMVGLDHRFTKPPYVHICVSSRGGERGGHYSPYMLRIPSHEPVQVLPHCIDGKTVQDAGETEFQRMMPDGFSIPKN